MVERCAQLVNTAPSKLIVFRCSDLYLPPFSTALSAGYSVSPDLERFVRLLGEKTLRVSSDPAPLLSRLASVDEDNMSEDEVEKAESLDRQHGALLSL